MRVVYTHHSAHSYWTGRLRVLSRVLECSAHELVVLEVVQASNACEGTLHRKGVFNEPDLMSLAPAVVASRIWEELERLQPDIVLGVAIAFTPGATAIRWCRSHRKPVIILDDARSEDVPRSRLVNAIKRRVYANVDAVLVPAPSHRPTFESFGIPADRIFYGVDVVDNDFFAATARQSAGMRQLAGITLPERYFLGVGRHVPKKNWPTLLRAYEQYRRQHGGTWELVLVGEGPEREANQALARSLNLPGVHFLPFVEPEQLCIAYAHAGAFVLPSFYGETWGLVVNEAMACGLPVLVSSECGCSSTLVSSNENGWTFSPHSPEELARLLLRMSGTPDEERLPMGEHSRQIISHWSLDRFAQGAWEAIQAVKDVRRGFASIFDRVLLNIWKGRYRPT